ncbi:laminin subunit alpha-1, partial [Diachasma alloeum]|uniref:laminin subunit alpha-1 n=1 Tax=Diachasma alloeum TaxID=454923 RepID=UPI00073838CB
PFGVGKSLKNGGLFPSTFNVATKADVYVNATCGEEGPETFCKPSESARCAVCDARSPDPGKRHNISNVLNPDPGKWWQSPTLARGERFEFVTIVLDLKQVYQIENVIVKSANSPRPAAWVLERSVDGEEFRPWQYHAPSDEECWSRYSVPPVTKPIYIADDEVICTSIYSRQTPMENGEIHIQLANGRPGAQNHSETLQEFTQARYVRLSLQGLRRGGGALADKRRAFYSIKEISIGGRCLCSGHASRCRYSARHGHQECECERHTCGERCDKCCPMFNQVPWKPGTSGKGFHCEKCNCNGHANSCRYDPEISERRMSLDIRGKYRGGGVCINCTDHTTGINCEKCQVGYYRPNGIPTDDPSPCIPCDHCNMNGSTGFCTPDETYPGKVAGACECKPGYSGFRCDQCAAGYRQFPDCMPCPCDRRGILPSHDCEGDCLCKANVEGEFCDDCRPGFFALTRDNPEGCLKCDCFGMTTDCRAARLVYDSISTLDGWLVTDINASRSIVPGLDPDNGWLTLASYEVEYESPFWLAPKIYAGNRLSSYGSNLTYAVTWIVMRGDTSGKPTTEPNVILVGKNGMKIAFGEEPYSGQEAEISVPLQEEGWFHMETEIKNIQVRPRRTEYGGRPVSRGQMLRVLADVKYVMIRAQYHSEQAEGSLLSVVLPIGEKSNDGVETFVEQCTCPEGYAGLSCEYCAWGYVQVIFNGTDHQDHYECIKCDCNGHAGSCDLVMGECTICEHHTTGPKCDRCAPGYYGDATRGTPDDCKQCACPLTISTNQFSPSCQLDDPKNSSGSYVCTQCPVGYTGDHCESCDLGYFGDPTKPEGTCQSCPCNGGTCDQETGRCLECRGNTEGWRCDRCKEAHYGDPLDQSCLPCSCNPNGSISRLCDSVSGQCLCKPLFTGRDCSTCIEGYGNVTAGCRECNCDVGAITNACDQITGSCVCAPGVTGDKCDVCEDDHYGLSIDGCQGCRCNMIGSTSSACDIVSGQCLCKPNIIGRQCHQCQVGYWGMASGAGCAPCGCDTMGSTNVSCHHDTGQCFCRPGVGGARCDNCLSGYYGFSENGCQVCDPCTKPGHVCDPDTGRCVCPRLTFGEHCDRCRPDSYDLIPGIGCKACACTPGSTRSQCDFSGQCPCRVGFEGLRCDKCAPGYYGYPKCKPCNCHAGGTIKCDDGLCHCDQNGQCPCKEYALGRQCNQCKEGTFGLSEDNPKGCTECFCFGRSTLCHQAGLTWGQRRLTRPRILHINESANDVIISNYGYSIALPTLNGGLNVTNGLSIIPGSEGDVILPANLYYSYPLYWQLPESFLGDKVVSYGGFLRFKTSVVGGIPLRSSLRYPLVQIQGNDKIILEYYQHLPVDDNNFKIRFHESLWQIQNRPDYRVSREVLMVALQDIQHIYLKASDLSEFHEAQLLEASLDAAVLTPTHTPALATGIEICECPTEYNNTSCQDPSIGYYRWYNNETTTATIVIDLVGQARPCQCNGRSEICDIETGYCLNCREDTAGEFCHVCAESFHGYPDQGGCQPCPCPHADKRFSKGCVLRGNEAVCHCKPGYTGSRCERCSYGYFGYPTHPNGTCTPCNCNPAGSASDECDEETGQCNCRPGSTGRDCSQCTADRHVFINNICTSCNDNCTGLLLEDLSQLSLNLTLETTHIADGYIPPPWVELAYIDSNATELLQEIDRIDELKDRMRSVPWGDYQLLRIKAENLLKSFSEVSGTSWDLKPKAEDFKNNIFSSHLEVRNLRDLLEAITTQLIQYGDDVKRVGIKKALKEARMILSYLKSVNLTQKTMECQRILDESEDYIEWLTGQLDLVEPLDEVRRRASRVEVKAYDIKKVLEGNMETLFQYDTLFNQINGSYAGVKVLNDNIRILTADTVGMIEEGVMMNEEGRGLMLESQNSLQAIPELKQTLDHWTEKLTIKEGILYRLNYEYQEKYVTKAVEHSQNLSDYVDRYVALFDRTRTQAANPLKAVEAYKHIVENLQGARVAAAAANESAYEAYYKVYPKGSSGKSLLDAAAEMSESSAGQLDLAQALKSPLASILSTLETHQHSVQDLKSSLNSTGIKDNQINIKLRELQSSATHLEDSIQSIKSTHQSLLDSIQQSETLINDYKLGIQNNLLPQLSSLKHEGDSKISLASEQITEAQSNVKKADAKLISLTHASQRGQQEFSKWNKTLSEKLKNLKDKIAEARNTAEGIRVSLKSSENKKCMRSFRSPSIQPSSTNNIVITLALIHHKTEGALFYLPSSVNDDFLAIELFDSKIRFLWNVGGGTGVIVHPEELSYGDPQNDESWYRIEAERLRNVGRLTVRRQVGPGGSVPISNSTNPQFSRFDVATTDRIWLGGAPASQRRPSELLAPNGLPGCVHQVLFDNKQIGLWNFVTSAPDKACKACVEGIEETRNELSYSFNGDGYSVRNRVPSGPYNKYTFGVSLTFRTFDESALLFLAINEETHQHVMIYLREGRVVLQIDYGGNISMEMSSTFKYNNGNWTKVDAFRQYQLRKNIEKCSLSVGENDKKLGAPTPQPKKEDIPDLSGSKYYFGGVPPSFRAEKLVLPHQVSFLGCMSNINVQEGYDPMAEVFYGVEPSCSSRPMTIVGFYGDGYLEHRSFPLKKKSANVTVSFRTMQHEAALVLSTFQGQEDGLNTVGSDDKDNYYSIALVNGQVQVRINAGVGELTLQSNSTFNDGKYHTVTIMKRRKNVELRIDDAYQDGGVLPSAAVVRAPEFGGLFFGGLTALINDTRMIGSVVPLYGAIKEAIFNEEIIRFQEAVSFDHALIGRSGPVMGREPPNYMPSASLSRGGMSTQPEGCQKVPYYSLEPGALKFGDKQHSHTQLYLNFKKFWEKKYTIEFDFRTYYPNGLLFITPGIKRKQYLMVIIKDSMLSLIVKSKQKKEMVFKTPFNDGNWHHVVIGHEERRLTLVVDAQSPRAVKVPKKIGLESMMYIGGLPESGTPFPDQVVAKLETLKGCIRGLKVNGNVYDMVGSTSRPFNVGQCFPSVESGAYFQDDSFAVYKRDFELGAVLELQLEFRTSELFGVLLSISAPGGSPSLSLEINAGKIVMAGDPGDRNPTVVEQSFGSTYTICDNRWHKIQAVYNEEELTLKVDELDQRFGLPVGGDGSFLAEAASFPLFIGGLPATAPKGTLLTRDHFHGCIRNVMIGGERRDWTDMAELHNIHLSSCPVQ